MAPRARTKAKDPDDPNALKRVRAGAYRSADERFEVQEGGTGWFIVDTTQADELGQQIVQGPYATLAAVRDALPEARRTTVRPLPQPRRRSAPKQDSKPKPQPDPEPEPEPEHPLVTILREAAAGRFPEPDGSVEVFDAPPGRTDAIVAFTNHTVVAAGVDAAVVRTRLRALPADPGAPMAPAFVTWLGKRLGTEAEGVDVVLAAMPGWPSPKAIRLEPIEPIEPAEAGAVHRERLQRAMRERSEVRAFTDTERRGIVILGRGLADRLEVSIEVAPEHRGGGIGTDLARAALAMLDGGEPLFAQVSPGNAASLRAFLSAGFQPIGSEVLFVRT